MADENVSLLLTVKAIDEGLSTLFKAIGLDVDNFGNKVKTAFSSASASSKAFAGAANEEAAAFDKAAVSADRHAASVDRAASSSSRAAASSGAVASAAGNEARSLEQSAASADKHATSLGNTSKAAEGSSLSFGKVGIAAVGAAVGVGAFAVSAVKSAIDFQKAMELSVTQAGMTEKAAQSMGNRLIALGPEVGQSSTALANAFYHIASASQAMGLTADQQFDMMKVAAEGAAVGHADLTDTTNALIAAVNSGIGGVQNYSQAMGSMNAIVGAGNMKMEDLNKAFGTGALGVMASYGVSLNSVGTVLAFLTDQGTSADSAMTRLKMTVALMGGPTKQSSNILQALGVTQGEVKTRTQAMSDALAAAKVHTSQLAQDLKKPNGIVVALQDLRDHMVKAGVSASDQAAIITRAFGGGKMGGTILDLYKNLDKLPAVFTQIGDGANKFGESWKVTQQSAAFQSEKLHASFDAIKTAIGTALLPVLQKLLGAIVAIAVPIASWIAKHKELATVVIAAIGIVGALTVAVWALGGAFSFIAANPIILIISAIIGAILLCIKYHKELGAVFTQVWQNITHVWENVMHAWDNVVHAFENVGHAFANIGHAFENMGQVFGNVEHAIQNIANAVVATWNAVFAALKVVFNAIASFFSSIWSTISGIFKSAVGAIETFLSGAWNTITTAIQAAWNAVSSFFSQIWNTITGIFMAAVNGIANFLVGAWNAISGALQAAWNAISGFFSSIWQTITSAIEAAVNAIASFLSGAWSAISGAIQSAWNAISAFFSSIWNTISSTIQTVVKAIQSFLQGAWSAIQSTAMTMWTAIGNVFTTVWNNIKNVVSSAISTIEGWLSTAWNAIRTAAEAAWNGIVSAISTAWGKIESVIKAPLKIVVDVINVFIGGADDVLSAVGLGKPIPKIPGFARGGVIGGYAPGEDTVPAMLSPGEGILTPQTVKAIGGAKTIHRLNGLGPHAGAMIQYFDTGGIVSGGMSGGTFHGSWHDNTNGVTYQDMDPSGPHFVDAGTLTQYVNGTLSPSTGGQSIIGSAVGAVGGAIGSSLSAIAGGFEAAIKKVGGLVKGFIHGALIAGADIVLAPAKAAVNTLPDKPLFADAGKHTVLKVLDGVYKLIAGDDQKYGTDPAPTGGVGFGDPAAALAYAVATFKGLPYTWGNNDCSGIVQKSYAHIGVNLPRTSSAQWGVGTSVSTSQATAGDLVFYNPGTSGAPPGLPGHVGFFVNSSTIFDAYNTSRPIGYDPLSLPGNKFMGIKRVASKSGGGATAPGGNVATWINAALAAEGWPSSWAPYINTIIMRESGGNPNAINLTDSNAKAGHPSQGLMQTIPSTFNAYRDPKLSSSITDPVANIVAAVRYILARYGSVQAVASRPGGYAVGAWDTGYREHMAMIHPHEMIVPAGPAEALRHGGFGGGGVHHHIHFKDCTFADNMDGIMKKIDAHYVQKHLPNSGYQSRW